MKDSSEPAVMTCQFAKLSIATKASTYRVPNYQLPLASTKPDDNPVIRIVTLKN